jgi:peptidoglycan/LPS O-acetylase OafA/YrhL
MSALIVSPLRLSEIAGDAAAAALYVVNFRFALEATNYLAVEAPSPLLHYWSLAVEEQFYLVWPLLLLVATRLFSLRWVGLFFVLLAGGSFALSLYWTEVDQAWAFFSPVTRAWQLAAGALIAIGLLRIPARVPGWAGGIAVVLGLALIAVSVVLINESVPFPGLVALLPVLGAVLVIVGGLRGPTLPGRIILANPLSRYLGRISYSLYLWHWPLLILVPIAIGSDELGVRVGLAGVAVLLAALSTELVERPFRRSSFLSGRSRLSVQFGLTGSVAVGVAALFMSGALALPSNIPMPWLQPDPVVVELAGVRQDRPAHTDEGCDLLLKQKKLRLDCVYGDPEAEQTAMLIGDSHAAQWMPAIDRYARDKGWRLELHAKQACAVTDVPLWERRLRREFDECTAWRAALLKHIRKTQPEAVFVGLSRDYEMWDNGRIVQSRQAKTYWHDKLAELLSTLDKRADRVILLAETPFFNYDPVDCLADPDISNCAAAKSLALDRAYAELESAAADTAGVELLSINELLCPDTSCPVVDNDIVVYRDAHHLTATYMDYLATPISRMLEGKSPYPSPKPSAVPGERAAAA